MAEPGAPERGPLARGAPAGGAPAPGVLEQAAAASFLLLVAALPWSIAPMSIGVGLCGALTLAAWIREPGGLRRFRSPVTLPAVGWLLALALATLTAADPAGSAPRITKALLYALVPVAAYHTREERRARVAVAVLLASSLAATLFALGEFAASGPHFPNRVRGAVGHAVTYGGQAMLLASLAFALVARARARGLRAIALGLLLLLLAALAFSFTRSAWLGFLLAAGLILATRRLRWVVALGAAALVVAVLLQGVYRERVLSVADPKSPWNVERVHMWRAGVRMFRDHPVTGVGIQDLHPLYSRYKDPDAKEPAGHLHSVWVQVAATMGIVGLAALVWLLAGLARSAARGLRAALRAPPRGDGLDLALRLGVAAGLAGFVLAGFFEWNLGDEELVDLLTVLVGMALAASTRGATGARGVESRE